jgi:cyclopropane fatty-acyl-phospholipid synthase-like methyltransferase
MIKSKILDSGCGTGENSIFLAKKGYDVLGIDSAPRAIQKAREKVAREELNVDFRVHDALDLRSLGKRFDTVIDSGLFHVFDDGDREKYIESVAGVLATGGSLHVLCFSDREPGSWGPRRIQEQVFHSLFKDNWRIEKVAPAQFLTNMRPGYAKAWCASILKL